MKLLKIKGHLRYDSENSADVRGVWIDAGSLDKVSKEFGGVMAVLEERTSGYAVAFRDRRGSLLFVEDIFDSRDEAEKACKERMAERRAKAIEKDGYIAPIDRYDFLVVLDVAKSTAKVCFRFKIQE